MKLKEYYAAKKLREKESYKIKIVKKGTGKNEYRKRKRKNHNYDSQGN